MTAREELTRQADRLRKFVDGRPERAATAVPELVELLTKTDDPNVLVAIAQALHAAWTPAASLALLPYASHIDERVRVAVARALPGGAADDPDAANSVAKALIALAADECARVRVWAIFGLGSILDVDTPDIRAALRAGTFDSDLDTRLEAILGLSERRDPFALDMIRDGLLATRVERTIVDAARAYGDPVLLPLLQLLLGSWSDDVELLDEAIRRCRFPDAD